MIRLQSLLIVLLTLVEMSVIHVTYGQELNDYGFEHWPGVPVNVNGSAKLNPWAGGLNNIQTGEIDLNSDGIKDLVLFEKHGSRILPFIFHPGTGNSDSRYEYDPYYRQFFPSVNSLFQLLDYNLDGKPDLFTYTTGGILVYKNVTEQSLRFERATFPYIKSLQGNIYTNLLVTNVDYPAIKDLDSDGDLDIITFWGLGSFMELHQNMSMEEFGTADSLLYHKVNNCWGRFLESSESNEIFLDTCVDFRRGDRHTGSTIALHDINTDNKLDLLLGDVDYTNITALLNSTDNMNARMVAVIDSFPFENTINIVSFPSVQFADLFNDGINDMIVSPFDPGLTKSAGYESVWTYIPAESGLQLTSKSFLQDEMIDLGLGAYPVFADITGDSKVDLLISNYGMLDSVYYDLQGRLVTVYRSTVSLYRNTGSSEVPEFEFLTNDFAGLNSLQTTGIYISVEDVNNDALIDMIVGTGAGELFLYLNKGFINGLPEFNSPVEIDPRSQEEYLTPFLVDLDSDGLIDIVAGNKSGKLSYYRNTGNAQIPEFSLVTHNYGQVNVTDVTQSYTGFSVPCFFRDIDNNLQLIVGSESGKMFYYPLLKSNPLDKVDSKEDIFSLIQDGIRSSVAVANLNDDNYIDLIVGNYSGGLILYKGIIPKPIGIKEKSTIQSDKLKIVPNPATDQIRITLPEESQWRITVYDSYGVEVLTENYGGVNYHADIKKLRNGFYVVTASQSYDSMKCYTGKFIITR